MEKEFVPYELAVKLKELGFDEPCFGYHLTKDLPYVKRGLKFGSEKYVGKHNSYDDFIVSSPTFSQAFRWFREKYHIHGEPFYKGGLTKQTSWYDYRIYSTIDWTNTNPKQQWKKYPEAELACLNKLIEIVEGIES